MQLDQLTLVTENSEAMVQFYNTVFGCALGALERQIAGHTLYQGNLGGFKLVLCPNALIQIHAERNRHQLHFTVQDIDSLISMTLDNGGSIFEPLSVVDGAKTATIADPDHNTIVLTQFL
jgi:predicted enzyme related to lactoylglutathione lyase